MKVQTVSSQNFNGHLVFVEKSAKNVYKITGNFEKSFQKNYPDEVKIANKALQKKPFNIYVSSWEKQPEFYELSPNENLFDYANRYRKEDYKPTYINKDVIKSMFTNAIEDIIKKFESTKV